MKTPKTIPPWMQRLALTVAGSALCLGARAQEITLNIAPAVHVSWATATNKAYQVELSTNVPDNWVAVGDWIEGTGGGVGVGCQTVLQGPANGRQQHRLVGRRLAGRHLFGQPQFSHFHNADFNRQQQPQLRRHLFQSTCLLHRDSGPAHVLVRSGSLPLQDPVRAVRRWSDRRDSAQSDKPALQLVLPRGADNGQFFCRLEQNPIGAVCSLARSKSC